jgi:hypothetical protein
MQVVFFRAEAIVHISNQFADLAVGRLAARPRRTCPELVPCMLVSASYLKARQLMTHRALRPASMLLAFSAFSFGAAGQSTEVPLDRWLRHMQSALPPGLCAEGTPIRLCFSNTKQECEKGIYEMSRTCIANMRDDLPAVVTLPDQGTKLGGDVGECVTDAYAVVNRAKFVASQACTAARQEAERLEQALPK